MTGFIHLHVHSEYSLADGLIRLDELVAACARAGMPAVAVTDLANLFGMVKFYKAAVGAGIKPIVGADVWIAPASGQAPHRLVLLCQNDQGYRHLSQLLTKAYGSDQGKGHPCIDKDWLADHSGGLIALTSALDGEIGQCLVTGKTAQADRTARELALLFPERLYIEIQRTGRPLQEDYNRLAVALARRHHLPVVATHDVRFLHREDFEAHEIRVCIHEGRTLADPRRPHIYTEQQYLTSAEEMAVLFADIPEALENSVEIAKRCTITLRFDQYFLPEFPLAQGGSADALVARQAREGLARRLNHLPVERRESYRDNYQQRLDLELGVIRDMGFSGYFLIVADFISWAKSHDVPVGPGRGSGAGSLVAYALGITELDPIEHELLFERFLNPERVSLPDFDIDFCMDGRDRVIEYVTSRYGSDRVSQIITFGTMAAKAVVRDVGRVLDHPYGYCDKLAKLIPHDLGITLDEALTQEPLLQERYDNEEDVRALLDAARKLEGIVRNASKHAGGVVIAPSPLTDFMPLYREPDSTQFVTQLDKDDVEALGLVKFDFLGLRTLTIIAKAVRTIDRQRTEMGEPPLALDQLPVDDAATYDLLKSCRTTALFQLESRGMKELIQRLKPDNFEEIVALVALFRPGPLQSGMVDDFINRKHGARIEYPHPVLAPILKPTYGVILYQEQVMQIAQVLAGYSLGRADLLRRAMGKKKPEEMAAHREGFVRGAAQRGYDQKLATTIFNLIEKFAGYGFNRSHSAAYALLSYHTAWLKAHYPAAFMAGVLSADMDKTDKVVTMIAECREMAITVRPPDVNQCFYEFLPVDDHTILYGLGAIKGLGESAIQAILDARGGGRFRDLFDLCRRVDVHRVNRRVLECLIAAGACDGLGPHRAAMAASLDQALAAAEQQGRDAAIGQDDIFGNVVCDRTPQFMAVEPWSTDQQLQGEKETLGLYLTGHPVDRYAVELLHITGWTIASLKPPEDGSIMVGGLIVAVRAMNTRRGDRMAIMTLDDRTGRIDVVLFGETYSRYRQRATKDALVVAEGRVSRDEYSGGFKMTADALYNMDEARAAFAKRLIIDIDDRSMDDQLLNGLREALTPGRSGHCPITVHYRRPELEVDIVLGEDWMVTPDETMLRKLGALAGDHCVHLVYGNG